MELIETDLQHVWHPTAQMKDYETFPPLPVLRAKAGYIELMDGSRIFDAISSWWCKSLGHSHPRLQKALTEQMEKFEHVLLANMTHKSIVELSYKLSTFTQTLDKVFFASDGASAVEIAIKMALHSQQHNKRENKNTFMALRHAYHGETILTAALSDLPLYRRPYESLMPTTYFLEDIPYVNTTEDPLWENCAEVWSKIQPQLNKQAEHLAAIIVEPILQGAGGMLLYSKDFLRRLSHWCQEHHVYLIADEIMTGCGRTGFPIACHQAGIEPDFLCLGKGLTAGWLPLSAVLTSTTIYQLFYDDYHTGKGFMHSHTYSGNALACAVAVETLKVLEEENLYERVRDNQSYLIELMQEVADTGGVVNVRGIGAVVAADLNPNLMGEGDALLDRGDYYSGNPRWGYQVYQHAVKRGALLRPLNNTLYWLPPFNTDRSDLIRLRDITIQAIQDVFN